MIVYQRDKQINVTLNLIYSFKKQLIINFKCKLNRCMARLAQSVERETFNLKVKGSTPLSGEIF
jgi:hypothetical protein